MADLEQIEDLYVIAEELMNRCSREQLCECLRMLAMNVAGHRASEAAPALEQAIVMLKADTIARPQVAMLEEGMHTVIKFLSAVRAKDAQ